MHHCDCLYHEKHLSDAYEEVEFTPGPSHSRPLKENLFAELGGFSFKSLLKRRI